MWRSQFEPLLLSHDLMGYVGGSNPCPEKFTHDKDQKPTPIISTPYLTWYRQDQTLLSWIHATLSKHFLSQVVGLHTSRAI